MLLSDVLENGLTEAVGPTYSIYHFTDQLYKVIRFKSTAPRLAPSVKRGESKKDENKPTDLHSSISRAKRVILELALCNQWDYFCTFTLSSKYDRFDLRSWYKDFSQFIRDQRKKYQKEIAYLLVPETHKDGAWHIHGLIRDAPPLVRFADRVAAGEKLPPKLSASDYESWPDYERRFGFNSFGRIRNPVACSFYITKYVSKSIGSDLIASGAHRHYNSKGLKRASHHGDVYGNCAFLDQFLHNHYDFCSTGMTKVSDGCDWTFGFDFMDSLPLEDYSPELEQVDVVSFAEFFDFIQDRLEGFN